MEGQINSGTMWQHCRTYRGEKKGIYRVWDHWNSRHPLGSLVDKGDYCMLWLFFKNFICECFREISGYLHYTYTYSQHCSWYSNYDGFIKIFFCLHSSLKTQITLKLYLKWPWLLLSHMNVSYRTHWPIGVYNYFDLLLIKFQS